MRLTPSKRQLEYLRSIGAWNDGNSAVIPSEEPKLENSPNSSKFRYKWLLITLLSLLLLILVANAVRSGELNSSAVPITNTATIEPSFGNPNAQLYTDESFLIVMVLLIFGAATFLGWWSLKYLIKAIRKIAISLMPIIPDHRPIQPSETRLQPPCRSYIHRPQSAGIPDPESLLQNLANFAKASPDVNKIPYKPEWSWSQGFATEKGNVRAENQDYVICFRIAEYDFLMTADGLGGLSYGRLASYLAVLEGSKTAVVELSKEPLLKSINLKKVLGLILNQAQHVLSTYGDKLGIDDINGGLRTTVIVVIANEKDIYYGYIGDGALDILRTNGQVESIMIPQKFGQLQNVLSASLGPQRQGDYVTGQIDRTPGDLLIVSTDGVADRIEPTEFSLDIMRCAINKNGNLPAVAKQIVGELASAIDDDGYICDDNLTLALLGTGQQPILGPDFWTGGANDNHDEHESTPSKEELTEKGEPETEVSL